MEQFTKEQAIRFYESGEWKDFTNEEIVKFQLYQDKCCLPFGRFHLAVEAVLERPVWSHEFALPNLLREEYEGKRSAPTFKEIVDLIPEEKRMIIIVEENNENIDDNG